MEFIWDDKDVLIGYYRCELLDDNGKKLESIHFWDYTKGITKEIDRKNHYPRPYSFEVSYCCGYSMSHGFDYDEDYRSHVDEDGKLLGGYNGNCTKTVDDIKRWCEEYLANIYINAYEKMVEELDDARRRARWFVKNGYGESNIEYD